MDLAYDGVSPPVLLEYNANSPTGVVEAAIGQFEWLRQRGISEVPFAPLEEALVKRWTVISGPTGGSEVIGFCRERQNPIDEFATAYLQKTADLAGLITATVDIAELAWDPNSRTLHHFGVPYTWAFKLWPWDWLFDECFGADICSLTFPPYLIEPPWKMILATKAILPLLWELFPRHPNLLPASFDRAELESHKVIAKPALGRCSMDIAVIDGDEILIRTSGPAQEDRIVYQSYFDLPDFEGYRPIIGSWVVGTEPVAIGLVEFQGVLGSHNFRPHFVV